LFRGIELFVKYDNAVRFPVILSNDQDFIKVTIN